MKKFLFLMLSAFLLTLVGSLDVSAQRVVYKKTPLQQEKTCDMRYVVGQNYGTGDGVWSEMGKSRYARIPFTCGVPHSIGQSLVHDKRIFYHDISGKNHHWVFFIMDDVIVEAEPYHYNTSFCDFQPGDLNFIRSHSWCDFDFIIDFGKDYRNDPGITLKPGRDIPTGYADGVLRNRDVSIGGGIVLRMK